MIIKQLYVTIWNIYNKLYMKIYQFQCMYNIGTLIVYVQQFFYDVFL